MASKKYINENGAYAFALARISIGLIFLWAFFDKLIGLGFSTCRDAKTDVVTTMCDASWLQGGSPTTGFLKFGTKGPLASFYQELAGQGWVDMLFMAGLLLIGTALVFGIAMKLAAITGSLLLLMMWSAALLPEHHPFIDDHIVYIFVIMGLAKAGSNQKWSARNWWSKQQIVKKYPILA